MDRVNKELINYIEKNVLPVYEKDNSGHRMDHIEYVIRRSLKFANQFDNINLDMVYAIAAYHDLGHHIDKDNHEILSAQMFYDNNIMEEFFIDEERIIIKEAIEDHRASLDGEPRSNYGKIISSADRNVDMDSILRRIHAYSEKHYPHYTLEEMIERAHQHTWDKFSTDGYAKTYCFDSEFEELREETDRLIKDKEKFRRKYLKANNLESK